MRKILRNMNIFQKFQKSTDFPTCVITLHVVVWYLVLLSPPSLLFLPSRNLPLLLLSLVSFLPLFFLLSHAPPLPLLGIPPFLHLLLFFSFSLSISFPPFFLFNHFPSPFPSLPPSFHPLSAPLSSLFSLLPLSLLLLYPLSLVLSPSLFICLFFGMMSKPSALGSRRYLFSHSSRIPVHTLLSSLSEPTNSHGFLLCRSLFLNICLIWGFLSEVN